jgi:acyl-CoA dehydrogenase
MDFELTRENLMVRDAIRNWVSKECGRDLVGELDEKGEFPRKLFKKLAKLGFSGMTVPEEFDGEGKNILGSCLVVEELSYAYPALASAFAIPAFCGGAALSELGSLQQKEETLPRIAKGDYIVSPAFSEKESADQEFTETEAVEDGDGFLISGTKDFVSLADQADLLLVSSRIKDQNEEGKLTLFCLDASLEGITIEPQENLGYRGASFCTIRLDKVRCSKDQVLGGEEKIGQGVEQREIINNYMLLVHSASAIGISRGAFDYALRHARERVQFGQKIGGFPAISHKLAEVFYKCEASRFMTYKAAWMADRGENFSKEAAMAKCIAAESAVSSAMEGLQILGGYGYTMEYDIQRYLRDSIATLFAGKSLDFLKDRIGATFGLD